MRSVLLVLLVLLSLSCANTTAKKTSTNKVQVPKFDADSAYTYVKKQVDFGPRVPNTDAHKACADYLSNKLKEFGADVIVQKADVRAFDNTVLHAKNIIGQYKPELNNRVLLFAHWDSRPFADQSPDKSRRNEPILGANDGASGVGVLLELARNLQKANINIGVDIIFFDAEDYGKPDYYKGDHDEDAWCLGTQYWSKHPHRKNYYAKYGILLDMVGSKNATFYKELSSLATAPKVVDKVWKTASKIGYSNYFVYDKGGSIIDDHIYVNKYLGIPCIDIIHYDPTTSTGFGSYWHTHNDTMGIIDKNTLKVVGQTLLEVLFNEK